MNTYLSLVTLFVVLCTSTASAQLFDKLKKQAQDVVKNPSSLTQEDAAAGLKEALIKGISNGADLVSRLDGYYKNPEIKIPFPAEAKQVESKLRSVGLGKQADDVILSVNRAAEDAATEAKPVFIAAIKGMTFSDALSIVRGDERAATTYLQRTTTPELVTKFTPIIKSSLEKVNATKYWETAMTSYNKIPFITKVNPNLTEYVTQKAIEGLFIMIAKEELAIRKDPAARTSELLKKVFG